jgi:hypothetical protein
MPDGIRNRHGAALRESEQRETVEPGGVGDRFHIAYPGIEGNLVNVPVRQAITARIVSDKGVILGKSKEEMLKNRQLPIIFEMTEPMRRPQQRRSAAGCRIGQPDTVGRFAIANLLLKVSGGEKARAR